MGKVFELELQNEYNRMRDRLRWVLQRQPMVFENPRVLHWISQRGHESVTREIEIKGDTEVDVFAAIDAAMEESNVN